MDGIAVVKQIVENEKFNLSKQAADAGEGVLDIIRVGAGWDPTSGMTFDGDLSVAFLGADGTALGASLAEKKKNFIYWGNLENGFCKHTGDNLDGEGDGDDEAIDFSLAKVPADCAKINIYMDIYDAAKKNQTFGNLDKGHVRLLTGTEKTEKTNFDLDFDATTDTCILFGSLLKRNGTTDWYFIGDTKGIVGGLATISKDLGLTS
jgi:tellurium resistance protein TerD